MEIKIGDVVRLKSGGHSMTVSAYPFKTIDGMEHFDKVECQWFNEDGLLKHYVYSVEELDYEVWMWYSSNTLWISIYKVGNNRTREFYMQ